MMSPDDIEEVLGRLEASGISVADADAHLLSQAAHVAMNNKAESGKDLDLSAGKLDKTNDPVRLDLREMGIVPLLTRQGEVTIAQRIERGQQRAHKTIARSPIAVVELLKICEELADLSANIREMVIFSEHRGIDEAEDKAEEYRRWTLEGIDNIQVLHKKTVKAYLQFQKVKAKPTKKPTKRFFTAKYKLARLILEIAHEN